jgi:hypothetical protein
LLVRFTHYKRVPLVGLLLSIAALVPLALAPTGFSPAAALGLIALVGLGLGATFPFTIVVVQNAVALHQLGVATGTMNFFRALGSTFIVAGFGAIVLAGAPVSAGCRQGGAGGHGRGRSLPLGLAAGILCLVIALAAFALEGPLQIVHRRRRSNDRLCVIPALCACPLSSPHAWWYPRTGDKGAVGRLQIRRMTSSSRKSSSCADRKSVESTARATEPCARAQYLLRSDAGHVPVRAQPDHRRRLADHRPRLRRFREPVQVIIAYLLSSTIVAPLEASTSTVVAA